MKVQIRLKGVQVEGGKLERLGRDESKRVPDLGPGAGKVVTQIQLNRIVTRELRTKFTPCCDACIRYGDGMYYLPTLAEVRQLLRDDTVQLRTRHPERFDCDDFAFVLKGAASSYFYRFNQFTAGLCLGVAWGYFNWPQPKDEYHAANWFVAADDEQLRFIEPQSDGIHEVTDCNGGIDMFIV